MTQTASDFLGSSDDLIRDSDTPTAESIVAATALLEAVNTGGPRAIILATDGAPDDCDEPNSHGPAQQQASVAAVGAALAKNIETYVISVGDDVAEDHLQDLANAGVGVDSGAPYYEALNATALADAFNEIIFGVTPCEFELNGTVEVGAESQGTVVVGGVSALYQGENGWDMPSPSTVTLSGAVCEAAKAGALVEIDFPCQTFVPNAK